jgi:HEAT repeat protein
MVSLGGAAVLLLAAGVADAMGLDAKARAREICTTLTDHPVDEERNTNSIVSLGEEGRKALASLASSKEPVARCALGYLVRLEDKRALPIIRKVLGDSHADVGLKEDALFGVAAFEDHASIDEVIEAFRSGNPSLVQAAARVLGALGDERGLRAMLDKLADSSYPRPAMVRALGVKGYDDAIGPLVALAADPVFAKHEWLRGDVILSLSRIGTGQSRAAALDLLGGVKEEALRRRIASDLSGVLWQQRRACQEAAETEEIDALLAKLKSEAQAKP